MEDSLLDDDLQIPKAKSVESAKEIMSLKSKHSDLHPKVKHGKIALWVLIGYSILGMIVESIQTNGELLILAVNGIYIALLIGFAFLVKIKNLFYGLLGATIVFLLLNIAAAIGDPFTIIKGILIKGAIFYYLLKGIQATKPYLQVVKELKNHNVIVEDAHLV